MTGATTPSDAETTTLILASASPRRRELIAYLGVAFEVVVSTFDESSLAHLTDPVEYVTRAAAGKAEEVAGRRDGLILGVDTDVVAPDGTILGKPIDDDDARRILRLLSGRTHRVYSSLQAIHAKAGTVTRRSERLAYADVTFADLSEAAIEDYLRQGEHRDKAGAYGIQGHALSFVARIEGDLSCVIGLPLTALSSILQEYGIPLWNTHRSQA